MRIKTKLRLNTWISLAVVILVLLSLAWSFREGYLADRNVLRSHEIEKAAFDRILLRDDYLLHREERAKAQWIAKSEVLRGLLKSASNRFTRKEEKKLLQDAQGDFEATFTIFSTLLEKHKRAEGITKKTNAFDEADSRMINQVFLKAYALNDDLGRLHELSRRAAITARNRGVIFVIFFIASGVVAIVINSIVVNRLVAKRVAILHEGAEIIGAGNLDYRIDEEGDDELSDLARASNEMVAKLQKSHVSVENLQREVSERKQAEERERHLSGLLRAIRNVNQLIVREKEAAKLIRHACELLIETRQFYSAWVALFDPEGHFLDAAEAGIGGRFNALLTRIKEGGNPQCSAALQRSEVYVFNDPEKECPDCPIHDLYENRSALGIRLEHGGRVYGLLVVSMPTGYASMNEEQSLVVEIAGDIGLALHGIEMNNQRKRTQEELQESEEKYRLIVENSRDLIYTLSPEGKILFMSPAVTNLLGYDEVALVGRPFRAIVHPNDVAACMENIEQVIRGGIRISGFRYRVKHASGEWRWHSSSLNTVYDEHGHLVHLEGVARDITDQFRLEEQLIQAQKMEVVGRLAGGVAHDFNNLLTVILGNAQLALMDMGNNDPFYAILNEIKEAGDRAARLTGQLLAFSRKQVFQPEVLNLNEVVREINKMLRRLIGEDIDLQTNLSPTLGLVETDVGQIEQVIMNLAVNARDSMPGGGKLTIETANIELDEEYATHHVSVIPGSYVVLSISDNGIGMTPEVQAQIFDPFFTTKERDKGTGLGLSTVYGIVKQSRGNIWVYSEVGKGTTFKIYLPRLDKAVEGEKDAVLRGEACRGSETILVVEDNESVRNLAIKVLERFGYRVLKAKTGQEAIEIFEGYEGPVHLLLTDVIMPLMNGKELAEKLEVLQPDLKVLFMSGYTDNAIVHHGILDKGIAFIQKPFLPEDLGRKVRETLEG